MATAQIDTVIRHLRRAVFGQDAAGRTDGQLLASFIDQKDEAAFEALVRRHGPMVFGVCRRVVGNHHDAEDAFQATFLVLARKASSVRPRERVANWLHGVALRTAMKAKAMTAKRRGRERPATAMPEPEAAQQDQWRDLQPLLDQELNGLPERYRLPILLCHLEGKTIKDAAQQLGWPQGTLAGRLARGRKLLAKRLAKRGVALSAGALAAVLSQQAASACVSPSIVSSTIKAASSLAAGQAVSAGVISVKVAALMEGVMKTMLMSKLKAVTMLLVAATLSGTAGVIWHTQASEPPVVQQAQEKPRTDNGKPGDKEKRPADPELRQAEADVEQAKGERTQAFILLQQAHIRLQQAEKDLKQAEFLYTLAKQRSDKLSGTVRSSPAPAEAKADGPKHDTPKTDLDRLQGIWSVVSIEEGGKLAKLEKIVFMVDGKRACWQTSESEMQGGLYLDPTGKPKTYDFVMSERTIEGIYSLDGDTLRLCHDTKRPVGFATQKDRQQVLFVLKRIHGPEVFPYRLADGSRAFPPVIERVKKATPPPQVAPTPKDNNKYDFGLTAPGYDFGPTAPGTEEPPATKDRQQEFPIKVGEGKQEFPIKVGEGKQEFPVKVGEGKRITVESDPAQSDKPTEKDMHTNVKEEPTGKLLFGPSPKLSEEQKKLQGSWTPVSWELFGEKMPNESLDILTITFKGDKVVFNKKDNPTEAFTYKIDADQNPHRLNLVWTNGPLKGKTTTLVYQIDGATLRLSNGEAKQAPYDFTLKRSEDGKAKQQGVNP